MHAQALVIEPPIKGQWTIYNPPGHPPLAFDFLAVDERKSLYRRGGFLRHLVSFIPVADTLAWSCPVFSPVDGVVVASHDGEQDRTSICFVYDLLSLLIGKPKETAGFGAFGGNHVMIRAGDSFVLLCHLKRGSVQVGNGETVKAGRQVGEVGNSGSSIQPHLHVQVMSNDRYFPLYGNLVPFRFSHGKLRQDGNWSEQQDLILENRRHYLFE